MRIHNRKRTRNTIIRLATVAILAAVLLAVAGHAVIIIPARVVIIGAITVAVAKAAVIIPAALAPNPVPSPVPNPLPSAAANAVPNPAPYQRVNPRAPAQRKKLPIKVHQTPRKGLVLTVSWPEL